MYQLTKLFLFTLLITLTSYSLTGQNFEGTVTYKTVAHNPNPEQISAEHWEKVMKEQLGNRGYMIQKYYYKKGQYYSEVDGGKQSGFQMYNPKDGLLYSWQANTHSAITIDTKKNMDEFVEIIETDDTETIMDILCKKIIVKSKMGQMTIWYNSDHLKMDPNFYIGHKYGHWERVLQKTGCLPLKIEQKGFMMHISQTVTKYKQETVSDDKFTLPEFKDVIANPMN